MKIVSACLVGINCRWNRTSWAIPKLVKELKEGKIIPLCPEQLGGLPTPRSPAGIFNGTGDDVLAGKKVVLNKKGEDITEPFLKGSQEVLKIAKMLGIKEAVLKRTSPCCGVGKVWRKSRKGKKLSNKLVSGDGVLTALLKKNGIKVISEKDLF